MNDMFRNLMRNEANYARDRAAWEGASVIERATFGKIFNAIGGILGLIALFGCFAIASVTQNTRILTYICGLLWLIPFIGIGILLARFRQAMFVRVRGIISNLMGSSR